MNWGAGLHRRNRTGTLDSVGLYEPSGATGAIVVVAGWLAIRGRRRRRHAPAVR